MDQGRELFERLKGEGWALLEEWRAAQEPETLHLEFKRKEDAKTATIDAGDRDNVARTLSAFANTEGGLLVLGVAAGGGSREGFDRASGVAPIVNAEQFGGALERIVRSITNPPIAGLMVTRVEKPDAAPAGIVAIYVPRSAGGPHRVTNAGKSNDKYYVRTAAGAQVIPHSLLAALFAYTSPPRLELRVACSGITPNARPSIELRLLNRGRSAARAPAVWLFESPPKAFPLGMIIPPGFVWRMGTIAGGSHYRAIEAGDDLVIYPDSDRLVLDAPCEQSAMRQDGSVVIHFHARIMSLETAPIEGDVRLTFDSTNPRGAFAIVTGDDDSSTGTA